MGHLSRLSLALLVVASLVWMARAPASAQTGPGRVSYGGGSWWLLGANMPWLNWANDFGGGLDQAQADQKLAAAQAAGMHVVRWWVFEGGAHIQRAADGTPTGLDPQVMLDMDAAVALAAKHDIYLDFTLFNAPQDVPGITVDGQHQALADVLASLFARYKDEPHVMAWEPINEPNFNTGSASQAQIRDVTAKIAAAVHAHAPQTLVAINGTSISSAKQWTDLGADFYLVDDYGSQCPGDCPNNVPAANAGVDKPVVAGEMYPDGWNAVYANGYAGAWCWSLSPEHTGDQFPCDTQQAASFAASHPDVGPKGLGGGTTPTAPPTSVLPPATATAGPPTNTPAPPTATPVPPTNTPVPPTSTPVPPTPTRPPASSTPVPSVTPTSTPSQPGWCRYAPSTAPCR
jgi:hypothetical protein